MSSQQGPVSPLKVLTLTWGKNPLIETIVLKNSLGKVARVPPKKWNLKNVFASLNKRLRNLSKFGQTNAGRRENLVICGTSRRRVSAVSTCSPSFFHLRNFSNKNNAGNQCCAMSRVPFFFHLRIFQCSAMFWNWVKRDGSSVRHPNGGKNKLWSGVKGNVS